MKEITDEDLILYIYNEAPPVLKVLIEKELNQKKGVIAQRMNQLKGTLHQLELKKLPSPSPASIQQLLQKAGIKSTSRKTGK